MLMLAACFLCPPSFLDAAALKDSESASHGDAAASYQLVKTYDYPGFRVLQFNLSVLSHYSYLIISRDEALVVDPGRDAAFYVDAAIKEGARVKGVFVTHSHADFVAGHVELAKATGCPIHQSAAGGAGYAIEPVKDGTTVALGEASVRFIETPGHTPDGVSACVFGSAGKQAPECLFTGDALFVGSVGRPDLMEGKVSAASLAAMLYDTWHRKLAPLGDNPVVFPAHGAGSLCGAHLSDAPSSTLGAEKATNPYLQHSSRADFIAAVLDGLPEAPQYFKHNAAMNRKGPEIVAWHAPLPAEMVPERSLTDPARFFVVDLRDAGRYAAGHIPHAVNIGVRGRLETWVGTMVPWGENIVLCGNRVEVSDAVYRLHRVGYRATRWITMENWERAGLPVSRNPSVSPQELYAQMQRGEAPVIVDVRLPSEWMGLRIGLVINLPLTHLSELAAKLDPAEPAITVCNSAYRSSMAVGILERKGFRKVSSLAGGSEAWVKAGLPVHGAEAPATVAPRREIRLPERMAPAELKRLLLDLPGTFELVDIRPAAQFNDFSIPGSSPVDVVELLSSPAYLTGAGPLIIVDRDGSLAMAVAGVLSQKTHRPIKALHGGVEAYWEEAELKPALRAVPLSPAVGGRTRGPGLGEKFPAAGTAPVPAAPAPSPVPPSPPATTPAKTKSAGC
jgi:glyoxylase-like metal-dependent hydrolase (beta-lactamase superfamily II)/rhodanese-related sulfurtransferase